MKARSNAHLFPPRLTSKATEMASHPRIHKPNISLHPSRIISSVNRRSRRTSLGPPNLRYKVSNHRPSNHRLKSLRNMEKAPSVQPLLPILRGTATHTPILDMVHLKSILTIFRTTAKTAEIIMVIGNHTSSLQVLALTLPFHLHLIASLPPLLLLPSLVHTA